MKLRCYFDAITDICVGFITLENGRINASLPYFHKNEVFPLEDASYGQPINWMETLGRDMELNVYPLGKDIGDLLFHEEKCKERYYRAH